METNIDCMKYRKSTHLAGVDVREIIREKGKCELTIKLAYYEKKVNVNGKEQDGYFIKFEEPNVKEFMPNSGNRKIISKIIKNKNGCSMIEAMNIGNWSGLKINLLFDPDRTFGKEKTGGILVDEYFKSQPKKTLEQAKSDFEKVNSRESFVKAMKDNEEFMQNAEILSTCQNLATKYPRIETPKI